MSNYIIESGDYQWIGERDCWQAAIIAAFADVNVEQLGILTRMKQLDYVEPQSGEKRKTWEYISTIAALKLAGYQITEKLS